MHELRFRQVHLDFHTSPHIPSIGAKFNRRQWQEALRLGHVNSITCFATCHHGWSYNDTTVGVRHPHLAFDLLRAQFDAAKEIDVNVPVYLTAGVNNRVAREHPEWRELGADGRYLGWVSSVTEPGFHTLCFNSPYTDYLCELIRETVRLFPEADGIFLDIISQGPCCCTWCLDTMHAAGLDPRKPEDRGRCAQLALERYYRMTTEAVRRESATMPLFHNSGHIRRGDRDLLKYFSHLELESLPTGGWGYDHYPISAKYCKNLPLDFLGMTGKFHTTWGEFGGYKHPNALRYECAAMLAYGSKCSVGDQLHPSGEMDLGTYSIIGAAYAEVEAKEPWCDAVTSVADVGMLSQSAVTAEEGRDDASDVGAGRILLEGGFLFDVLDADMDFDRYRVIVAPDSVGLPEAVVVKLVAYLAKGGRLLLAGRGGLNADGTGFLVDVGAELRGLSPYQPDYVLPAPDLRPDFVASPFVMYAPSYRIRAAGGASLGQVFDPYFNRDYRHFSSHQHTPPRTEASGFDCGVRKGGVAYLAHPVFSMYRGTGAVAHKDYVVKVLKQLLGGDRTVEAALPSTGRVTLMEQAAHRRYVLHLLYANTITRGGPMKLSGGNVDQTTRSVEVIEDLVPLRDVEVTLRLPRRATRAVLQPAGRELPLQNAGPDQRLVIPEVLCHQMVELSYA